MRDYEIIIKNGAGCVVYNEIITAENENMAIKNFILNNRGTVYCGDTITIEEC